MRILSFVAGYFNEKQYLSRNFEGKKKTHIKPVLQKKLKFMEIHSNF